MADARQNSGNQAIDVAGGTLATQAYVPATAIQQFRAVEGVDESTDGAGNHYAALAVADHLPSTDAGANIFYATGTTGTQTIGMAPSPAANVWQVLLGVWVSLAAGTTVQTFTFTILGVNEPTQSWFLTSSTTVAVNGFFAFPRPIRASASATQIKLQTGFPAASTALIQIGMWGYNRAV